MRISVVEKYQKWLVEYAKTKKHNSELKFPLRKDYADNPLSRVETGGFHNYLVEKQLIDRHSLSDRQAAVQGVQGMLRFANHDNPLLLEALGDLLTDKFGTDRDAKRIAARCYLKASYVANPDLDAVAYRKLAENALEMQTRQPDDHAPITLAEIETEFKAELADADVWYAGLRNQEADWIATGLDADAAFDRLYTQEPAALGEIDETLGDRWRNTLVARYPTIFVIAFGIIAICIGIAFWLARRYFRNSKASR